MLNLYEIKRANKLLFIILVIIDIIAVFFSLTWDIIQINRLEKAKLEIENLELYNRKLKNTYDEVRSFKHDFSNIVQALGGYISTENISGLKTMYKRLRGDVREINNVEILNPLIINDPAVCNLLNKKYSLAKKYKITMDIDVFVDFNEIDIHILDFCRVLGILIDNAIEAAKECEKKEVSVRFLRDERGSRNVLVVENSYLNKELNVKKMFEKEYTTKPEKSCHGLGLWKLNKIVSKNDNLNLKSVKGEKFVQILEIYDKRKEQFLSTTQVSV